MFNEAAKTETQFILVPLTTHKLYLASIQGQGSQTIFWLNQTEHRADCKLGMIDGRPVQSIAMADAMHAACTFAFGA